MTSQVINAFLKLSNTHTLNKKNDNLNININNCLSKNNHLLNQYSISNLFSNNTTIAKIKNTLLPNFTISLPAKTANSLSNKNVVKDEEILCNNLSQHCKNCQEKQKTLEKQLINTQQKLIEMRQVIQRVGLIANVLLKNEEKCKSFDEIVSDKTNTQLNEKNKQEQLPLKNMPKISKNYF